MDSTRKKIEGVTCARRPRPLFKILYAFVSKKSPGKITDKDIENLKQASGDI